MNTRNLRNIMVRLLRASFLLVATMVVHGQPPQSKLDMRIERFDSNQSSSVDQLIDFGKRFHFAMGIEWHFRKGESAAMPIQLSGVTAREVIQHILQQQDGYDFEESGGIVHIYDASLVGNKANFLNLRLPEFQVTNENLFGVTFQLQVSIKQLLHPSPGYGGGYGYGPGRVDGFDVLQVSFASQDISVRSVLSQAVVKQGNGLWLVILHPEELMAGEPFYRQGRNSGGTDFNWNFIALNDHLY